MPRGVWEAVEICTREIRMEEAERRGGKERSGEKERRKEEEEETEKRENNESKKSSRGMGNMR